MRRRSFRTPKKVTAPSPPPLEPQPLFASVVNMLTDKGYLDNKDLVSVLSKSQRTEAILVKMQEYIFNESDEARQKALIGIYINILSQLPDMESKKSAKYIMNNYLSVVVNYTDELPDFEQYETLKAVMSRMVAALDDAEKKELCELLKSNSGKNSRLLLSVLPSADAKLVFERITSDMQESVDYILPLATFMSTHVLKKVKSQISWKGFGGAQKISSLIKSALKGNAILVHCGIELYIAAYHFLGVEAAEEMYSDLSISVMNTCEKADASTAKHWLKLYNLFKVEGKVPQAVQLEALLKPMVDVFEGFEGEYIELLTEYVSARKKEKRFKNCVIGYLQKESSARNMFAVAARMGLLDDADVVKAAFPGSFEDARVLVTRDCIQWIMAGEKHTQLVFVAACEQMFTGLMKETIVNKEELGCALIEVGRALFTAYDKYSEVFGKTLLEKIQNFTNIEVLKDIAKTLNEGFETVKCVAAMPDASLFCSVFVKLFTVCWAPENREVLFQLFRVFQKDEAVPTTLTGYIDFLVPEEFIAEMRDRAFRATDDNIVQALLCAALPGVKPEELSGIMTKLLTACKESVDVDLYKQFCEIAFTRYPKQVFDLIAKQNFGDNKNEIVVSKVSKFQKKISVELVDCAIAIIVSIAHKGMSLDVQESCYQAILKSLPEKDKVKKVRDVAKLIDVFAVLTEAKPPKELSDRLVKNSLFAEAIPILMTSVEGSTELSIHILQTWVDYLAKHPLAYERNKLIVNIAYQGAAKHQRTAVLVKSLELCIAHLEGSDENVRSFADLAWESAWKAKRFKCSPPADILLNFLVKAAPHVISQNVDVRVKITTAIYKLFGVPRPHDLLAKIGSVLSVTEIHKEAIRTYKKVCLAASTESGERLFKIVSEFDSYPIEHAIMMRGVLGSRAEFTVSKASCTAINKLINSRKKLASIGSFHFEKAILKFAKWNMGVFLPILVDKNEKYSGDFRMHILELIIASVDHKTIFLEEFHKILVADINKREDTWLFSILHNVVSLQKTADISAQVFGYVLSELVIWMSHSCIGDVEAEGDEEITKVLNQLLAKTNLGQGTECPVNTTSTVEISETMKRLAKALTSLEIVKLDEFSRHLDALIDVDNSTLRKIIGILVSHLISNFLAFGNEEALQYCAKLANSLDKVWNVVDDATKQITMSVLRPTTVSLFSDDMKKSQYSKLLNALAAEKGESVKEDPNVFFTALMKSLPDEFLAESLPMLLQYVRSLWREYGCSIAAFNALERYVSLHADIQDFLTNEKPTLGDIWMISTHGDDEIEKRGFDVLNKLRINDKSVGHTMAATADRVKLVDWATEVLNNVRDGHILQEWYELLADVSEELKYVEYERIYDYEAELMRLSLFIAQQPSHPCRQRALQIMSLLLE